jgi:hypothetical protein
MEKNNLQQTELTPMAGLDKKLPAANARDVAIKFLLDLFMV